MGVAFPAEWTIVIFLENFGIFNNLKQTLNTENNKIGQKSQTLGKLTLNWNTPKSVFVCFLYLSQRCWNDSSKVADYRLDEGSCLIQLACRPPPEWDCLESICAYHVTKSKMLPWTIFKHERFGFIKNIQDNLSIIPWLTLTCQQCFSDNLWK